MNRRPNNVLQERIPIPFDHGSLSASLGSKIFNATGRNFRVDSVKYYNLTGLAEDASNTFAITAARCGAADALVVADFTFTTTHGTETINATAHGLLTGDGPLRMTNSGGALPAGYSAGTDYYVIKTGADSFQVALSRALAYAGTAVAISGNGTGTHTMSDTADTRRPVQVASGIDTDSDLAGTNTLTADQWITLTLATDTSKLVLAPGDDLLFLATMGGTATLPPGRMIVEGRYL